MLSRKGTKQGQQKIRYYSKVVLAVIHTGVWTGMLQKMSPRNQEAIAPHLAIKKFGFRGRNLVLISQGQAAQPAFNMCCYKSPDSTFLHNKRLFFTLHFFQHYYSLAYGIFCCIFLYLLSWLLKIQLYFQMLKEFCKRR